MEPGTLNPQSRTPRRRRGLSKSGTSMVIHIFGVTPFRGLITLLITYLLSPLGPQVGNPEALWQGMGVGAGAGLGLELKLTVEGVHGQQRHRISFYLNFLVALLKVWDVGNSGCLDNTLRLPLQYSATAW